MIRALAWHARGRGFDSHRLHQDCYNIIMPKLQSMNKRWVVGLTAIAVLLVAGFIWYKQGYASYENVFWGAISNNLATSSATRRTTQKLGDRQTDLYIKLNAGSQNAAEILQVVTKPDQPGYKVVQDKIGTPVIDYVSYQDINTLKNDRDFSKLVGVWGQSASDDTYTQAILSTFPTGNLKPSLRSELVRAMQTKHVFSVNFEQIEHPRVNGQITNLYNVKINPVQYFEVYQQFLNVMGLDKIDLPNPDNYANSKPLELKVYIKPEAREIVKVSYINNQQDEFYSSYGLDQHIEMPDNSIPLGELQKRVRSVQQ